MKRKIPALLLALAMIAGLFGASTAAAASDSDTELAMAVFEGLGAFEDGAMTSSAAITRGEFARLLAYALGKGGELLPVRQKFAVVGELSYYRKVHLLVG